MQQNCETTCIPHHPLLHLWKILHNFQATLSGRINLSSQCFVYVTLEWTKKDTYFKRLDIMLKIG